MKKALRFLTLAALLCIPWVTEAQTVVEIGDETELSNRAPITTEYNYSISEMLYTADEIATAGTITSIAFNYANEAAKNFSIHVYMKQVTEENLWDGISFADATLVYEGMYSVTGPGWFTINLETPFAYDGSSNLLIGVIKDELQGFMGDTWVCTWESGMTQYSGSNSTPFTSTSVPSSYWAYRPNIQLTFTGPTCGRPTALTVSNVTTNGASFAWESTVGNYTFEYKTEADDDWTVVTGLTSNTYTLNTLASGTAYQVRVKNVCGVDQESPYKTASFTTLYSFPLVEDFGTSAPDLWPQYEGLVDEVIAGTATLSAQGGWSFGINAGVNSKHAYSSIWGNVDKWLVTPALTIGNNVQLTFDVALTYSTTAYYDIPPAPQTNGTDDRFVVLVGVMEGDAVSSWTILREWNNAIDATYVLNDIPCTSTGMEVALDLSAYAGESVCIAFYVESTVSNADNNLHIDNVSIDYIPTCVRPATLEASNVATTSATLTWTGGNGTYNVQYKTAGDDDWTSLATNTTSLFCNMTGLSPNTRYQVRVQSACGDETSRWMTAELNTLCAAVTSFPWTEDFECYSAVYFDGVCWVNEHISGEGSELFRLETYATGSNNTKHLRMPSRGVGNMTKLRLPQMTLPNDNYTFSIDVYRYFASYNPNTDNYTMEGIRVFVSTDGEIDGATELAFIPRAYHVSSSTIPAEAEEGWYTYEIPIGISGTCYIILRVDDQYIGSNYMDNFIVMETPTCRRPTNLAVTGGSVTGHEATITWTAGEGGQDAWVVAYKKASDENFTEVNVSDNPTYTFTNLDPLTEYNVKVRANCGGTPSRWEPNISTVDFTTDIACTPPRGLAATLTPGNGSVATLSWTSTASDFVLAYSTSADFTDATVVNLSATSKDLTGLTPEATYYARVKAVCGDDGESSWSSICTFTPTNAYCFTINNGDASDAVPVYGYYVNHNTCSQFIIPAASLAAMQWATIDQLVFYANYPNVPWTGAEFEVYMTEVNYTTFSSISLVDWTEMDKVMTSAHLEINDNQMVVTLTDPYQYLGGNLMIGFKQTTSASGNGTASFLGVRAIGASLSSYNNSIIPEDFLPKTTFYFTPGVPPSCVRPTGLTISNDGGTTATVSWTSTASAWNLKLNGTPVEGTITNPYTLTGLTLATDYSVEVQADCGSDGTSQWTNPVRFSTGLCLPADKCELTFELTDSYGDSWNGNAIRVTDVLTGEIIGEMTNENLNGTSASGEDELNVKTLAVCDDREIQFSWVAGNYSNECSYVVKDINGEEIFSGSGAMASPVNHTVSCGVTSCRIPRDFTVSNITKHGAQLSWTERGEATAWKVAYKTGSGDFVEVDAPTNPFTLTGLDPETDYTVKVRSVCDDAVIRWSDNEDFTTLENCPAPTALSVTPTPTSAQVAWTNAAGTYNLRYREYASMATITLTADDVWGNGTGYQMLLDANADAYGTLIPTSGSYFADGDVADAVYNQFEYKIPLDADGSLTTTHIVTDGNSVTIQIPAGVYDWCITNPTPDNKMWFVGDQGNVAGRVDDYVFEAGKSYEFNVYFNGSNDAVDLTVTDVDVVVEPWTVVNGITDNPYTLEGLTSSTTYQVQVQADCGSDGESEWSAIEDFITLSSCIVPTALASSDITSTTATLSWTGYQESFNLKYRSLYVYYSTDFNDDSGWQGWNKNRYYHGIEDPINNIPGAENYFNELGLNTTDEDYIISPLLPAYESGTWVEFYHFRSRITNTFQVGYSSTTNETSAFSWSEPINAGSGYTLYTEVLPAGTKYVAFKATASESAYGVLIDNFRIVGPSDWVEVNNVAATTYNATGLSAETEYEFQVQGIHADCAGGVTNWSTKASFTTPEACPNPTALTVTPAASSAQVAWNGFASSYTLQYAEITPYWLQYDNNNYSFFLGDGNSSSQWKWGVMYPAAMLNGITALTKIAVFEPNLYANDYTVNIYSGGDVEPGTLIGTETVTPTGTQGMHEVTLSSPLTINPAQNLWITITATGAHPMALCEENDPNNQWLYYGGSWQNLGDVDNSCAPYGWMIRAGLSSLSWTTVNDATSPATINSLNPATDYVVRVKGDCGSDGESGWSYGMFTTSALSKDITANQWYALSSPMHDNEKTYESFANVTNLTSGTYDLMRWNEVNGTWQTSKPAVFNSFVRGRGYIYRRSDAATLSFLGKSNTGNLRSDTLYADCPDNALKGFNLVGNPYTKAYTPTADYYKLNANGTWTVHEYGTGSVAVAEGFFIKVASMDFYDFYEPSGAKSVSATAATTLAFTVSNDEYSDVAYARFGAGEGMPKFGHLNPAAPALSIPQEDRHYAIANLSESVESFPLAFSGTGEYTLTVDNTAAFGYLHLIDHATGADIDLLRTASYTFQAAGSDADRFLVKLSPDNNEGTFVRISGDRIIVDGTGELEVYDVMGRQLFNTEIRNSNFEIQNSIFPSAGVYVLRLNGNSQKIVIK